MLVVSYFVYVIMMGMFDVVLFGFGYCNGVFIMGFMGIFFGFWIVLGVLLWCSEVFVCE